MNPSQRQVFYLLLWVALFAFGFYQRARINSMQQSVDDDLMVLAHRRASLTTKFETLAEKERAVRQVQEETNRSREQTRQDLKEVKLAQEELKNRSESPCCKEREGLTARVAELQRRLDSAERQLAERQQVVEQRDAELAQLRKTTAAPLLAGAAVPVAAATAEAEERKRRMAQLLKEGADPPTPPVGHAHRPHAVHPLPALGSFAVDNSFAAPPFLEPLVREWDFMRGSALDVGYLTLMPWPKKVVFGHKFVRVARHAIAVSWSGDSSEFAVAAVTRFQKKLEALWSAGGGAVCVHGAKCEWVSGEVEVLISVSSKHAAPLVPVVVPNERYSLSVAASGAVHIEAEEAVGAVRALTTLLQLVTRHQGEWYLPIVSIEDEAVYAWRGVLLDVSRHFHPVEQVLLLLEGMELVKLNVLHWHLSDDQGFRLELPSVPLLHLNASGGQYFTQAQVRTVVREAALRGIRVVPEIDMPAHAGALVLAYPHLAHGSVPASLDRMWGVRPWVLDPSKPEVYQWIGKMLDDVVALFPDPYFHIGGDEVPGGAWSDNSPGWLLWKATNRLNNQHDIQLYFNKKLVSMLGERQRKMVGWDEITVEWLPKNVTVQIWRPWVPQISEQVANLGLASISSAELYLDWVRSVKQYYRHNVRPSRGRIGGEACMWSEWAADNIDNRLWPTLAAVAEKFWLSEEAPGGAAQMYGRLFGVGELLSVVGIPHKSVYDMSLRSVVSGKPFSYAELLDHRPSAEDERLVPLRRFVNCLHPVNRVGGGEKHDLVHVVDAIRPDSLEMRALAGLMQHCGDEKFGNREHVSLLRASLALYAQLPASLEAAQLMASLAGAEHLVKGVALLATGAVEMLDMLARGDRGAAATASKTLLAQIKGMELEQIGQDKVIVEFAHVVETSLCVRV